MRRGLQQKQSQLRELERTIAATTPAMQALIEASTAASEAEATQASSLQITIPPKTFRTATDRVVGDKTSPETTQSVISPMHQSGLANLDPNEHARVNDPILRPAKKNTTKNKNKSKTHGEDSDCDSRSSDHGNAASESTAKKAPIGFSESILSRLFEPDRKQKPELWEFIRLVAPGPANQPPKGQYKWRSKDAVAAYCLKCKVAFTYTPGTSKTVSRHLIAYHEFNGGNTKGRTTQDEKFKKVSTKALAESAGNSNSDSSRFSKDGLSLATRKRIRSSSKHAPNTGRNIDREDESTDPPGPLSPFKKPKVHRLAPSAKQDMKVAKGRKRPQESQEDTTKGDKTVMDLLTTDDDEDGEDAFLRGHGRNRKAVVAKAFFRWWVGSYQSLDWYNTYTRHPKRDHTRDVFGGGSSSLSLFIDFCKTLDDSFELPEPLVMESMANISYERLETEIKIHVSKLFPGDTSDINKSHEFVSASVRRIKVVRFVDNGVRNKGDTGLTGSTGKGDGENIGSKHEKNYRGEGAQGGRKFDTSREIEVQERTFYPVRLTFCTPMFRIKSYVIAVIPGESDQENGREEKNESDKTALSPYSKAVESALQRYGFPRDNVSCVVIRGSCQEVDEGVSSSGKCFCILDRLDGIFARALESPTMLPEFVQKLLRREEFPREEERQNSVQRSTSGSFCTIRAHQILLASLPQSEATKSLENNEIIDDLYNAIAGVIDTITPLRDAIKTLSEDSYPTIGLAIPVLRRVSILLHQRGKSLEDPQNTTATSVEDDVDDERDLKEILKSFHMSMLEDFEKNFYSALKENPDLMWTVPLDPRLIAMRGLSEIEQTKAKSMLVSEVAKIVEFIDRKEKDQRQNITPDVTAIPSSKSNRNRFSSASTMGGIFWGDESDPTANCETESKMISSTVKDAKQYAEKNVHSYFNTVHSQRQIKDPLLWWKNNQDQFPELAMLARKWISASAVYGRKRTRENESPSVIPTLSSDTESICRMIFLHDNNDLV